jgi:hypothetical protein
MGLAILQLLMVALEQFQNECRPPAFFTRAKALCFYAPDTALKGRSSTGVGLQQL